MYLSYDTIRHYGNPQLYFDKPPSSSSVYQVYDVARQNKVADPIPYR